MGWNFYGWPKAYFSQPNWPQNKKYLSQGRWVRKLIKYYYFMLAEFVYFIALCFFSLQSELMLCQQKHWRDLKYDLLYWKLVPPLGYNTCTFIHLKKHQMYHRCLDTNWGPQLKRSYKHTNFSQEPRRCWWPKIDVNTSA